MGNLGHSCLLLVVETKELSLVVDWLSSEDVEVFVESSDSESVVRKVAGELRFDSLIWSAGADSGSGAVSLVSGWLMALRCAITSAKVGVVVGGCGGPVRDFLHGAGIGFGVDGLEMVGICCEDADGLEIVFWCSDVDGPVMVVFCSSDVGGPEMVVFWCLDADGPEMVVFCCSDIDGLVMIEFDSEHMCWQVQQYVFPCDSST